MTNNNTQENKTEQKDLVEVPKSTLEDLMKKIERLESVANKGRLHNYDKNHKGPEETIIKLRVIDGKVITSWRTVSNNVYRDPLTKRIIEDQKIEVTFEDDTKKPFDLVTFNRLYTHLYTKLVEEIDLKKPEDIEKYGIKKFKLETEEGKEYEIGSTFVN